MLVTILGHLYVIILRLDFGIEMVSLDISLHVLNDGNIEGVLLGDSLRYTDGKVIGSNEGIKLGLSDGKVLSTILGDVDGIILGLDVGTELGSLDGSFDGYNYGKVEGLFI